MAFLTYVPAGTSASGKTKVWEVRSGANPLGLVAWYAQWRRYNFYPNAGTTFDAACLYDLHVFCSEETKRHKA